MYGNRGLQTEVSYLNGRVVPYGTKGSVRLDVFDSVNRTVWDYKFALNPSLTPNRIRQIIANGPPGIRSVIAVGP